MKAIIQKSIFTLLAITIAWSIQAQYDDVYYDPFSPQTSTSNTTSAFYNNDWEDPESADYDNQFYEYEDYTGYEYSSRIKRFNRPYGSMGYYSPAYVDRYYYDPFSYNPYAPWSYNSGVTIYMGYNPYRQFRRAYRPWSRTTVVYYNNPWWFYSPGYAVTTVYSYGPGWGWNNPYYWNPYAYNPYNPYGYSWYNTGYGYGGYGGYGGYYTSAHCPTYYGAGPAYFTNAGNNNPSNDYYGTRTGVASNTPISSTGSTGAGVRNNSALRSTASAPAKGVETNTVDRLQRGSQELSTPVRAVVPATSGDSERTRATQPTRATTPAVSPTPRAPENVRPSERYTPPPARTPATRPAPQRPTRQAEPAPPVRRTEPQRTTPQRQTQPERTPRPATQPRQERSGGFNAPAPRQTPPAQSAPAPSNRSNDRGSSRTPTQSGDSSIQRGGNSTSPARSTTPNRNRRGGGE